MEDEHEWAYVKEKEKSSRKRDRTAELASLANAIAEVVRERKIVHVSELAVILNASKYKIGEAWRAMGDLFVDIDLSEDGYFFIVKSAK